MGEALRLAVAPVNAFDINADREKIHDAAETKFIDSVKKLGAPVTIMAFKINNLVPPKSLIDANADLAQQQVLRQKSLAERDRVVVEVETMKTKTQLKAAEGTAEAAKIEAVGRALRAYPEFIQWTQLNQLPDIYKNAGQQGNMIVLPNNPSVLMSLPQQKAKAAR
jgi:regulator of protease activity HflC (stomatin/prohibitin superfamily)